MPTLKFKGVSFSAQEIEIKTAYGWFDACVAALKNEPTPAVAKFQALAMGLTARHSEFMNPSKANASH